MRIESYRDGTLSVGLDCEVDSTDKKTGGQKLGAKYIAYKW